MAASVGIHLGVLLILLSPRTQTPKTFQSEPMVVQIVDLKPPVPVPVTPKAAPLPEPPKPTPPEPAPPKPKPDPPKPPPRRNIFRATTPPPPDVAPLPAGKGPSANGQDEVSDAQLASAQAAGSGPSGGACDMARRLQAALRKDRQVQAAVAAAHRGKAIMVWNGDWVRHGDQEGQGLAAVREALMWEVAFAPKACRSEPVQGLILFSLNEGPGSARLVIGSGNWKWSDLLFARSGGASAR